MPSERTPHTSTPSTTWAWEQRKIKRRPPGPAARPAKPARWARYARWPSRRTPITLTITYRGGEECWYQVEARGSMGRWPGYVALHDVLTEIYEGRAWYAEEEG